MLNKPQNPKYEKIAGKSAKVRSIMCEMRTCNCPIITCDTCHKLGDDKMQRDHHHHRHHQGHQGHHLHILSWSSSSSSWSNYKLWCMSEVGDGMQRSGSWFWPMFLHCVNSIWKNVPPLSKVFGKIPTLPVPSLSLGVYHEIAKNQCIPGNYERMLVKGSSMILLLFLEMKASS